MKLIPEDTTQIVRKGVEQACRDFTDRIKVHGFLRTKKMFWTRIHEHTIDFIHFHRHGSTYGKPNNYSLDFRVHFGIRVINETYKTPILNGPYSDPGRLGAGRYHLRFNAKTGSTYDRCIIDLERFVIQEGEPWFKRFMQSEALLTASDSPLRQEAKARLAESLDGNPDPAMVSQSMKALGIKIK